MEGEKLVMLIGTCPECGMTGLHGYRHCPGCGELIPTVPTGELRTECPQCGGKKTLVGRFQRADGSFRGYCTACNKSIIQYYFQRN